MQDVRCEVAAKDNGLIELFQEPEHVIWCYRICRVAEEAEAVEWEG